MIYSINFTKWLTTMYSVTHMSIWNGAEVARKISEFDSVRKGFQVSMHLFVIYIKPLLTRFSQDFNGIHLFDNVSVGALVDDVDIFVSSVGNITNAEKVLDQFCKARMNKHGTKVLGLGNWRHRSRWQPTCLESVLTLSLLRIKFSPSIREAASRL
jgi:hypothetical protein